MVLSVNRDSCLASALGQILLAIPLAPVNAPSKARISHATETGETKESRPRDYAGRHLSQVWNCPT